MTLPWSRREQARQNQQRTEDQLSTTTAQLLEVGEAIGRLNTVATRFEAAATRIVEACVEDSEENDEDGNDAKPAIPKRR
jgi:hypothetical protein